MFHSVDFAADKYWAVRFELNEDELDLIRTMKIEFDARTLTTVRYNDYKQWSKTILI